MKKCKKLLFAAIMVVFVLLCGAFSVSALDDTGQCGENVYWNYNSSTNELVISGSGEMYNFEWGSPFSGSNIKSVVVKNGVTKVGEYAFYGCCTIEKLSLTGSVASIGDFAFSGCGMLKNLNIPYGVKTIGASAFSSCESLETIVFSNSVTSIKGMAFSHCGKIKNITIPGSVSEIDDMTFYACKGLEGITLNKGVKTIGYGAFGYCERLKSINIPESVETIGEAVFEDCCALETVTVDGNNRKIIFDGGALIDVDDGVLVYFFPRSENQTYTVPDYVTRIGDQAFSACSNLTHITIGKNVKTIGYRAFEYCGDLTGIHFPAKLEKLGSEAFFQCIFTEKITVDKNNKYFAADECGVLFNKSMTELVFSSNVEDVKNYVVPDTVKIIRNCAFYGNSYLESLDISDSVICIEDFAFFGCNGLSEIVMSENILYFGAGSFSDFSNVTLYQDESKWEDGVLYLGNVLVKAKPEITRLVVKNGTKVIADNALRDCTSLKDISIPDSVVETGFLNFCDTAYYNNSDNWEDGALYIGNHLVESSHPKKIKEGTKTLNFGVFQFGQSDEITMILPKGIQSMGTQTFTTSNYLKCVVLPEGITYISFGAFSDCKSLEKVLIPRSVTSILPKAFCDCNSLKDIYFTGSQAEWNKIYISHDNEYLSKATVHYNHKHSYKMTIPSEFGGDPDCLATKERVYTCVCGDSYTKTLTKVTHSGGTATCTDRAICAVCKRPYGKVNANNHKLTTLKAVSATYKAKGKTEGKKCTLCNKVTVPQKTVPMKKLGKVSGIKTSDATTKTVKLTWNKVTGAEKYEVKYIVGGKTLTKTVTANTVTLSSLKAGTTYTVTVKAVAGTNKGEGASYATSTDPAKAKIKKAKSSKKKTVTVSWGKITGRTKYEVQYSTSKKFKSAKKTSTTSTSKTIKKLRSKKKYYIRVRAYRVVNGQKIYGSWSSVKTVKIK